MFWLSGAAALTASLDSAPTCRYVTSVHIQLPLALMSDSKHFPLLQSYERPRGVCVDGMVSTFLSKALWCSPFTIFLRRIVLTVGFTGIIVIALRAVQRGQGYSAPIFA